jgi:hypothetical protein
MSRRAIGLILALIAGASVIYFWPKKPKDAESQIRELVAHVVAGVEKKQLGALEDSFAEEFSGPNGLSGPDTRRYVALYVMREPQVTVLNPKLDVTVKSADSAELEGVFVFSGQQAGAYRINATLVRKSGEWKFTAATYEQITWP